MRKIFCHLLFNLLLFLSATSVADTVYETPEKFIAEATHTTEAEPLKASVIWLNKTIQDQLTTILGHAYPQARLRYWSQGETHVWILEEIGKEYPITAGFVIEQHKIERTQVLIYRETRGSEIHLPQFLAQFRQMYLTKGESPNKSELSKSVDGISGATLSVNAMKKMAQAALYLDSTLQSSTDHQ